ncbi:MAG TPA: hypothetical protein VFA28_05355 [Bryobacteraceae bacterium]|jgi:predicted nucleotidyltransferase|nr:hypothetical protein [Bryobacteraceae bacterium]
MERALETLVGKLAAAYGDGLISVILYGSAAAGRHDRYSDLNIFCVLRSITAAELSKSEPIFRWWRDLGNPTPLLMTEEEARRSTDSFPIEFRDMQERRVLLHGRDIIAELTVNPACHRSQLEHDLRVKLLRLRQRAAAVLSERDALLRLCIDSVSTFCVLGRHAVLAAGRPCGWGRREVVESLERAFGADLPAFKTLLDVREGKIAPQEAEPATLFEKYLGEVYRLIAFVDALDQSQ